MGFGGRKKTNTLGASKEDDVSSVTSNESGTSSHQGHGISSMDSESTNSGGIGKNGSSSGGISSSLTLPTTSNLHGSKAGLRTIGNASRSFVQKRMVRDSLGPKFPDSERGESRQRASFLTDSTQTAEGRERFSDLSLGSGAKVGGTGGSGTNSGFILGTGVGEKDLKSPKIADRNYQKTAEGKFSKTPRATLAFDGLDDGEMTPRERDLDGKRGDKGEKDEDWKSNGNERKMSRKKSVFNSIIFSKHRNKK